MVIMVIMQKEQTIVQPKLPTNTRSSEWRWDPSRSIWLQWNESSSSWMHNHKPLPKWFVDHNGTIPSAVFLRLWKEAASWDELHMEIFWVSISELKGVAEQLAIECRRCGVEPPEMLSSEGRHATIPVSEWLEEGLVSRIEGVEVSIHSLEQTTPYDPMQALFEAQKKRSSPGLAESRLFFQTVEQGKFTAKH